jgi:hypothetical protein
MIQLDRLVPTLKHLAADEKTRQRLLGVMRGDGEFDVRIPPAAALASARTFFCGLGAILREAEATAVGIVLPVRTISGDERVCPYLDAEALALVAAQDSGDRVASVGLRCPMHALPAGWEEAHDRLQSLAKPLREALAGRPLRDEESLSGS